MFRPLYDKYLFTRDLSATEKNTRLPIFITRERDALSLNWRDHFGWDWLNPPYSRGNLERFTAKARLEVQLGWAGVLLVPATPGAGWFQKNILRGHDVVGGGSTNPAEAEDLQGFEILLNGNGYRLTVRLLKRRVSFWKDGKPMPKNAGAKTDSALIEYRPRRLF